MEQSRWLDCRTLRVPGGQLVCVIPLHSELDEFARAARAWPSGADPAQPDDAHPVTEQGA